MLVQARLRSLHLYLSVNKSVWQRWKGSFPSNALRLLAAVLLAPSLRVDHHSTPAMKAGSKQAGTESCRKGEEDASFGSKAHGCWRNAAEHDRRREETVVSAAEGSNRLDVQHHNYNLLSNAGISGLAFDCGHLSPQCDSCSWQQSGGCSWLLDYGLLLGNSTGPGSSRSTMFTHFIEYTHPSVLQEKKQQVWAAKKATKERQQKVRSNQPTAFLVSVLCSNSMCCRLQAH